MYFKSDTELREKALELAMNNSGLESLETSLARANAYYQFLKGDQSAAK